MMCESAEIMGFEITVLAISSALQSGLVCAYVLVECGGGVKLRPYQPAGRTAAVQGRFILSEG
jgi:hypothetical protein